MTGFGDAHRWYNDDHLFVSSGANCSITLSVPVTSAGRYRVDVYLTSTPDFGIVQVYLDQVPVGEPIDLFTPSVMPTGPITLGTFDLTQAAHALTSRWLAGTSFLLITAWGWTASRSSPSPRAGEIVSFLKVEQSKPLRPVGMQMILWYP
jgi:hypothetical protein